VWHIVGGVYSQLSLAGVYNLNELRTVRSQGIDGVIKMGGPAGSWSDLGGPSTPGTRPGCGRSAPRSSRRVMTRWMEAFVPKPTEPIPGVADSEIQYDQRADPDRPGRRG